MSDSIFAEEDIKLLAFLRHSKEYSGIFNHYIAL